MISIVGIGPGSREFMTFEAVRAIELADVIIGYDVYIELVRPLIRDKEVISTGMTRETERCHKALDAALSGKHVALVCSGDAGIYGMAGVMMEVAASYPELDIQVVAGVTAATAAAARLGAPLTHDFAIISLSDLLTPWEKIEKRIRLAAEADFTICLYNPRSKKRQEQLAIAVELMLTHKSATTPCGYVKNAGRAGEAVFACTLQELDRQDIDMFSTVIIGNSDTKMLNGRLVTPRGYREL